MSLARNTLYNLAGAATPIAVSLVTVPLYLHRIGEARYGVLAIVWLLLGYFGLFDMGLSRATANRIAKAPRASASERGEVFWTACALNLAFGIIGGLTLYYLGGPLLGHWFKMSTSLHAEALGALPWIAAAVPAATLTGVLTGSLEGQERFGIVNLIQAFGTFLFQLLPLAAAIAIGPSLEVVIPVAVVVRVVSAIPLTLAVKATLPLTGSPQFRVGRMRQLLGYGAWVTVTNVVGPVLASVDRFLIGLVMGASAVAYYVVPSNLVNQVRVLPDALARSLFPRISAQSKHDAELLAVDSVNMLCTVMTPLVVLGIFLVRPFLDFWVGPSFGAKAAPVAEILLLGLWINGLAYVPFAMLQAQGRPDLLAKLHMVQIAPYLIVLWWASQSLGLVGVAYAWTLRVSAGAALQFSFSGLGRTVLRPLLSGGCFVISAWFLVVFMQMPDVVRILAAIVLSSSGLALGLRSNPHYLRTLAAAVTQKGAKSIRRSQP